MPGVLHHGQSEPEEIVYEDTTFLKVGEKLKHAGRGGLQNTHESWCKTAAQETNQGETHMKRFCLVQ